MKLNEMRHKRMTLVKASRDVLNLAETEKRELTQEEETKYEAMYAEIEKLNKDIDREERQLFLETGHTDHDPVDADDAGDGQPAARTARSGEEYRAAFRRLLVEGPSGLSKAESRALQVDSETVGGYIVAPEQFVAELIKAMDNAVFLRRLGTVISLGKASSLGAASLDADPADATWTTEIASRSEDSTMSFGKRELNPHPLNKLVKISKTLVRRSALDIEQLVRDRLAYKFAVTEENIFLNGSGAQQPLGIFTASAHGINTDRDVSTGNTTTEITLDGLQEAKYALKEGYRRTAGWIFHTDAVKMIAKIKDGEGRFIWQPSVVAGQPDRILNMPVYESAYAPSTFTASSYVGILGDYKYYWIVDALDFQIQALLELYAATNQNGYIGNKETDGMPVLAEAFARVTLAAS